MRKINRAVKIRIYPNKEQITQIEKTIGCSRFLYNRMLADKIRHYQEEKKMLKNTPAGYKKEYPWLKEVDSLALANVQLNLEGAFRKFFREPGVGFPHYKSKKHSRKSYTTNMVNGNICLQDRFLKLPKMQRKLTLELGYEPSVTELAEALEMSEDKVMEIMQIAREPASLETPIGEEDDSNLGDFVADSNAVTPEGNVESVMLREHIDALLGDLKERERQVIVLRFGLEDGHPRTLEEVGKEFNVTRERIRQIEAKALRKLRNPVRSKRIRDFL